MAIELRPQGFSLCDLDQARNCEAHTAALSIMREHQSAKICVPTSIRAVLMPNQAGTHKLSLM
eukprot:COSAG02_NODE_5297_length_4462_cov_1.634655_1_plen_62_part_10